ncbi:MAG: class II glutamine amidotransferase [Myxococcaceae bacterium]
MSALFAIFTSDPNLLGCELHRSSDQVKLSEGGAKSAAGLGWYSPEDVLVRRFPAEAPPTSAKELLSNEPSDAMVFHSGAISGSASLEDNTQPFRFRRWLFAHAGKVESWGKSRLAAVAALPEYLQRGLRGDLDSEVLFALFLKELRDLGRTDDSRLEPEVAAKLLLSTGHVMQNLAAEAGATERSALNMVATNGRMLLAARLGPVPLFYKLLEGSRLCERCGLTDRTPESNSLVGAHKRVRSVLVSSSPVSASGWIQLEDGEALAVDSKLNGKKIR